MISWFAACSRSSTIGMVTLVAPALLKSASHMSRASATWLDAVVKPMIGAPSVAPVSSRNEAMGGPLGVAPPPIRIRVPVASRSRRCDARRLDAVAEVPLISDPGALAFARSSLFD